MNKFVVSILERLSKAAQFLLFLLMAIVVYVSGLDLSLDLRVFVVDNYCPTGLRHKFGTSNEVTEYFHHVDWCEMWWWHSFRVITRLFAGVVVGLQILILPALLRPRRPLRIYPLSVVFAISVIHAMYLASLFHQDWTQGACMRGRYDIYLTEDQCYEQLGSFGDQRFYYPAAVVLTFLIVRRRVTRTPQNA